MIRKILLLSISFCIILSSRTYGDSQKKMSNVDIVVYGKYLENNNVIIIQDRVYLPITDISTAFNLNLKHNKETSIILSKDNIEIAIRKNSKTIYINGVEEVLEIPVFTRNDIIYLPIKKIAEIFGEKVYWDGKNRKVIIGSFKGSEDLKDGYLYNYDSYSFNFPNSWKKETIIIQKPQKLSIYDKKTMDEFKRNDNYDYRAILTIKTINKDNPTTGVKRGKSDRNIDDIRILSYNDGEYIEAIIDPYFSYYPETKDSYYTRIKEARKVIDTFRENKLVLIKDKNSIQRQVNIIDKLSANYIPINVFDNNDIFTMNTEKNFFYMDNRSDEGNTKVKISLYLDENNNIINYRFKNYEEKIISEEIDVNESFELAKKFIEEFTNKSYMNLVVMDNLDRVPSFFDENIHRGYKNDDLEIIINREFGIVESMSLIDK